MKRGVKDGDLVRKWPHFGAVQGAHLPWNSVGHNAWIRLFSQSGFQALWVTAKVLLLSLSFNLLKSHVLCLQVFIHLQFYLQNLWAWMFSPMSIDFITYAMALGSENACVLYIGVSFFFLELKFWKLRIAGNETSPNPALLNIYILIAFICKQQNRYPRFPCQICWLSTT